MNTSDIIKHLETIDKTAHVSSKEQAQALNDAINLLLYTTTTANDDARRIVDAASHFVQAVLSHSAAIATLNQTRTSYERTFVHTGNNNIIDVCRELCAEAKTKAELTDAEAYLITVVLNHTTV